jgi:hypothetical protein
MHTALDGVADLLTFMPHGELVDGAVVLRASKRPLSGLLCTYQGANGSLIWNDGQRLQESAQWPIRSGQEVTMDFKDRRLWYGLIAVIVVLLLIGYAAGWFGVTPPVGTSP